MMRSFFGVLVAALDFLGVAVAEVVAPRAGASARSPESISAFIAAASFLIMRKRPSIESYVAPGGLSIRVSKEEMEILGGRVRE